jgi:hypothetical protein
MTSLLLLIDHEGSVWGEVKIGERGVEHILLTSIGERRVGREIRRWQTHGILAQHEVYHQTISPNERLWISEHISFRDRRFILSLRQWFGLRGCQMVTLPQSCIGIWHELLSPSIDPRQRYALMMRIRQLEPRMLEHVRLRVRKLLKNRASLDEQAIFMSLQNLAKELAPIS